LCAQPDQTVTATLSYPLSYLILSNRERAIFVNILDTFEFFVSCWSEVAWFGQFVVLQINYDVLKLRFLIMMSFWWRHLITSRKLRHQN